MFRERAFPSRSMNLIEIAPKLPLLVRMDSHAFPADTVVELLNVVDDHITAVDRHRAVGRESTFTKSLRFNAVAQLLVGRKRALLLSRVEKIAEKKLTKVSNGD